MARVNSILCYKGRTGATVTLSVASPCVLNLTAHGLVNGTAVVFTTTGALPTGVTAETTYYTRYVTDNTAHLYDTLSHAVDTANITGRVNTSGTQSGTHTIWSSYWYNLSTSDRERYGTSGSERVYAKMESWLVDRSTADSSDSEYLEISDEFSDKVTSGDACLINYAKIPSFDVHIETKINGVNSAGFHNGKIDRGYVLTASGTEASVLSLQRVRLSLRGFRVRHTGGNYNAIYGNTNHIVGDILDMIFRSDTGRAVLMYSYLINFGNSILHGSAIGLVLNLSAFYKCQLYNLTVTGNVSGVDYTVGTYSVISCSLSNVVSYGNSSANWPYKLILPTTGEGITKNNAGITGDYVIGASPIYTVTSAAFNNFAGNDFSLADGVLRDSGATIPLVEAKDILGNTRPNYSAGEETADLWDIGAFEYDSGNGNSPKTVTVLNMVPGSMIRVVKISDKSIIYSGAGPSFQVGYSGRVSIEVRCASSPPYYRPWVTTVTLTDGEDTTIEVLQILDE